MSNNNFEPLHISCLATNAIATDGALPLDGVLAHLWMREHYPDILYQDSVAAKSEFIEPDLPLQRVDLGHGWFYACSFVATEWRKESTRFWHKRVDSLALTRYVGRGKINISQGRHRPYRMPLFVLLPGARLHWYLIGDKRWIAARLPLVTMLGKKRTAGHGAVCDWKIQSIEYDYSIWGPEGQLMRAIPLDDLPIDRPIDFVIRESYAIRPPAWYPPNWVRAAVPRIGLVQNCFQEISADSI